MTLSRGRAIVFLAAAILALVSARALAHEVPSELTVDAYIKPDHQVLRLVIRVPLSGLMAIDMPKVGVGYLDLEHIEPTLEKAALLIANGIDILENGERITSPRVVATKVSLPFDTSFRSYDAALSHLTGPGLPIDTQIYWLQGSVDALLEYPIASDDSSFSFRTGLVTLAPQVTTALRFVPPDGSVRSFSFLGDPGRIWLDPRWYQAALVFLKEGVTYVLGIRDQWLFALCMMLAFAPLRSLPTVLSAFGIGQFLTSLVLAYGPDATGPWLLPLISTIVAVLLLGFAVENIAAKSFDRRWTTFAFGVLSGVGFSIGMRDVAQFAGQHRLVSNLFFDIGLQSGEVALFAAAALAAWALTRVPVAERVRTIIVSALIGDLAWHAVLSRGADLGNVPWPIFTPQVMVNATSWLIVLVVAAGLIWFASGLLKAPRPAPALNKAEGQ